MREPQGLAFFPQVSCATPGGSCKSHKSYKQDKQAQTHSSCAQIHRLRRMHPLRVAPRILGAEWCRRRRRHCTATNTTSFCCCLPASQLEQVRSFNLGCCRFCRLKRGGHRSGRRRRCGCCRLWQLIQCSLQHALGRALHGRYSLGLCTSSRQGHQGTEIRASRHPQVAAKTHAYCRSDNRNLIKPSPSACCLAVLHATHQPPCLLP